jgi:DNA-directed RNA polymerase sigma subunit (sigma70/sigma32)
MKHEQQLLGLAILSATTYPPHTRQTIAAYMGITPERVRQIEEKALRKCRAYYYRNKDLQAEIGSVFER